MDAAAADVAAGAAGAAAGAADAATAAVAALPHAKCIALRDPDSGISEAKMYPGSEGVCRLPVTPAQVRMNKDEDPPSPAQYNPPTYTAGFILGYGPTGLDRPAWADPPTFLAEANPMWNNACAAAVNAEGRAAVDAEGRTVTVNRASWMGEYGLEWAWLNFRDAGSQELEGVHGMVPKNPVGYTGLRGRGLLGRWGPNHAADPLVTRWKHHATDWTKELNSADNSPTCAGLVPRVVRKDTMKRVLQVVLIKRAGKSGTDEWALPGGMVDPGEVVTAAVKREFGEEAMASKYGMEGRAFSSDLNDLFNVTPEDIENGDERVLYKGYVDDPRNTDNAWMETVVFHFHDKLGVLDYADLNAGSDAAAVKWADVSSDLELYASHRDFVKLAAKRLDAHWGDDA